jgi:hypothetical protein
VRSSALAVRILVFVLCGAPATALAQPVVPTNAAIFIDEMENDLDGFIRAEFVKQKVPLRIVLEADAAELILTGSGATRKGSWHEGWLSMERDKATGNVMVVEKATKSMLWAGEAGDRSLMGGPWRRGGARKVAERLVKNLKKVIKPASAKTEPQK